jgi:hypothetical protein
MNLAKYNLSRFSTIKDEVRFLPTGQYHALLEGSDVQENKKGDILRLQWRILDGRFRDSIFYSYINLHKKMSLKVLRILISSLGLDPETIEDSTELHGNECILRVRLTKHEKYGASNLISYFSVTNNFDDIPFELIVGDTPGPAPAVYEHEADEKTHDIPMV